MAKSPASVLVDVNGNPVNVVQDGSEYRVEIASRANVTDMARGLWPNVGSLRGFGERSSLGTTAQGEDIWRGSATTIPTPPDVGEQMTLVSTSASDTSGGTGTRALLVDYIDADGNPQTESITMDGVTGVNTVATDIRFVQKIYTTATGSNGVAEGDITIHKAGAPSTVYSIISEGGNMSLVPHRMVPAGKQLIITSWHCTESKDKRVAFRLRATAEDGTLRPGVFLFKDSMYLSLGALQAFVAFSLPALAIVKVSGWGSLAGAETSCSWEGCLFDA